MLNSLDAALEYYHRGMAPIPIKYRDKRPLVKWGEYQDQMPTEAEIRQWFAPNNRNLALVTGHNGLTVLDFDDASAYMHWLRWCAKVNNYARDVARRTFRVRTARGMHIYTRLPSATRTRALRGSGLDIKSQGGYVLAPPSIHPSGAEYVAVHPQAQILSIQVLSDVLPAEVLVDNEPRPSGVQMPKVKPPTTHDPWVAAEQPDHGDSVVQKIKDSLTLEQFFPMRTKPAKGGRYWMTRCPFHDDKHPSMWLDLEAQRCGCFAGCTDKSIDVIDLYARLNDLSNTEAIRVLARRVGP